MLGYRKRSFVRAHTLLATLRSERDNIAALREIQALLLSEIIRAETSVRPLKGELKTIDPDAPGSNLKRFAFLSNRIEGLRRCAFIWRCFGDAIAFLYMDKYALKQTLYNTHNYNPKQSAGFIGGKEGLGMELATLDAWLDQGIPALLVDITNTIRHGDICLMVGPDPTLVEVKGSKGKIDKRGRKQRRNLEMLSTFFATDRAKGLRGMKELQRRETKIGEQNYMELMNACIRKARKEGHGLENPERGLFYVAMGEDAPTIEKIFADVGLRKPLVFGWNIEKSQQTWVPFVPFTLSIDDTDALWDFVEGKLFVLVAVEIDRLIEIANETGLKASFDEQCDPDYPLKFELVEGAGLSGISRQMIARIGLECISPETLIRGAVETYRDLNQEFSDNPPPTN